VNNELNVIRCRYDAHLQAEIHLYLCLETSDPLAVISPTSFALDSTCFFSAFYGFSIPNVRKSTVGIPEGKLMPVCGVSERYVFILTAIVAAAVVVAFSLC